MKLNVMGFGQCGGRVADEFARMNSFARGTRHTELFPVVAAVNTDAADLSGLESIPRDAHRRILLGSGETGGHGVGKINQAGADIARENIEKIIEAVSREPRSGEADGFLFLAGAGGGTGSGCVPVVTKIFRERYPNKPVYDLIVLPFEHEETTEEQTVFNTATCLKSCFTAANAVFLMDNQRYANRDRAMLASIAQINHAIAAPFYDLLCAGEEKRPKHIGAKTLDAGDIIQTLNGWTVIGYGKAKAGGSGIGWRQKADFDATSTHLLRSIGAVDEAMSKLSASCNPADAETALYLLCGPARETNLDIIRDVGDYLRRKAPGATIRNGDYPIGGDALGVHVVLSGLSNVEKVRRYFSRSSELISEFRKRQEEAQRKAKSLDELGENLPTLL